MDCLAFICPKLAAAVWRTSTSSSFNKADSSSLIDSGVTPMDATAAMACLRFWGFLSTTPWFRISQAVTFGCAFIDLNIKSTPNVRAVLVIFMGSLTRDSIANRRYLSI